MAEYGKTVEELEKKAIEVHGDGGMYNALIVNLLLLIVLIIGASTREIVKAIQRDPHL